MTARERYKVTRALKAEHPKAVALLVFDSIGFTARKLTAFGKFSTTDAAKYRPEPTNCIQPRARLTSQPACRGTVGRTNDGHVLRDSSDKILTLAMPVVPA